MWNWDPLVVSFSRVSQETLGHLWLTDLCCSSDCEEAFLYQNCRNDVRCISSSHAGFVLCLWGVGRHGSSSVQEPCQGGPITSWHTFWDWDLDLYTAFASCQQWDQSESDQKDKCYERQNSCAGVARFCCGQPSRILLPPVWIAQVCQGKKWVAEAHTLSPLCEWNGWLRMNEVWTLMNGFWWPWSLEVLQRKKRSLLAGRQNTCDPTTWKTQFGIRALIVTEFETDDGGENMGTVHMVVDCHTNATQRDGDCHTNGLQRSSKQYTHK